MKKLLSYILFGVLALSLAACSQDNSSSEKKEDNKNETKQSSQESGKTQSTVVKEGNFASNNFYTSFNGKIDHIHGLGYAGNQDAVFFAAHDGLKVYEKGKWYKTTKENNDYMGFNAAGSGFYTR